MRQTSMGKKQSEFEGKKKFPKRSNRSGKKPSLWGWQLWVTALQECCWAIHELLSACFLTFKLPLIFQSCESSGKFLIKCLAWCHCLRNFSFPFSASINSENFLWVLISEIHCFFLFIFTSPLALQNTSSLAWLDSNSLPTWFTASSFSLTNLTCL